MSEATEIEVDGVPVQGVPVSVEMSTERWSEFHLSDGSVLRAKVSILSAHRILGAYDASGNPAYAIQGGMTTGVVFAQPENQKPRSSK